MKPTLTIAIPAYNEEKNIQALLRDLAPQQLVSARLEMILVVSDGSTDRTVQRAKQAGGRLVRVRHDTERRGLSHRLNQILDANTSDVLVIVNADVRLPDPHCIEALIAPIVSGQADLTSCPIEAFSMRTTFEHALAESMIAKNVIFETYRAGDNLYACHGTARGFSKKLAASLRFPHSVGEDAYSYLFARFHGFRFSYVVRTKVLYRLPATIGDHRKQSLRFAQSKRQFIDEFGATFVHTEYALPFGLLLRQTIWFVLRHPLHALLYSTAMGSILLSAPWAKDSGQAWDIVESSK